MEEHMDKLDKSKVPEPLQALVGDYGFKIEGQGIIIKKLEKVEERLDNISKKLWALSKDFEKLLEKQGIQTYKG